MKIKRLFEFNQQIFSKEFPEFTLIVGEKSEDIFNFFGVDEMHGLKKVECYDRSDDVYIAGLCNVFPNEKNKIFLFLNRFRFQNNFKDSLLIMHECMHLSLELKGRNLNQGDLEEEVITWAEETAAKIYELIKSVGKL